MILTYCAAIIVMALSFVFTVFTSGGSFGIYLDLPSTVIMVFFPFVYQCLIFGTSTVKLAFTAGFNKNASLEDIKRAQLFFKSYSKTIWIAASIAVLIGFIAMLTNLEDPQALGPNMALASVSLVHGGLLYLVIIIPHSVFLKRRLLTFTESL